MYIVFSLSLSYVNIIFPTPLLLLIIIYYYYVHMLMLNEVQARQVFYSSGVQRIIPGFIA